MLSVKDPVDDDETTDWKKQASRDIMRQNGWMVPDVNPSIKQRVK